MPMFRRSDNTRKCLLRPHTCPFLATFIQVSITTKSVHLCGYGSKDWARREAIAQAVTMPGVQNPFFGLPSLASIGRETAKKTYKDGDIVHTNLSYEDETKSDDLGFWHSPIFKILLLVTLVQGLSRDFYCFCSRGLSWFAYRKKVFMSSFPLTPSHCFVLSAILYSYGVFGPKEEDIREKIYMFPLRLVWIICFFFVEYCNKILWCLDRAHRYVMWTSIRNRVFLPTGCPAFWLALTLLTSHMNTLKVVFEHRVWLARAFVAPPCWITNIMIGVVFRIMVGFC